MVYNITNSLKSVLILKFITTVQFNKVIFICIFIATMRSYQGVFHDYQTSLIQSTKHRT